jgi:small subunit ribosomal protein S9
MVKEKQLQYYEAVGRRRESVARVRLYLVAKDGLATIDAKKYKKGSVVVNNKPLEEVYSHAAEKAVLLKPLLLTGNDERFVVSIRLAGGGHVGQLEAAILGIARAIEKTDKETHRPILKKEGLLSRDPRTRERRMPGTGGKSRRQKQSPKR